MISWTLSATVSAEFETFVGFCFAIVLFQY
jgi:hypothetical protein